MSERNAIIMAAGMSTRFVPLSVEMPKALIRVRGEVLIERQIKQLKAAGISEIVVVTGYLKEQFDYLSKHYGVILIENPVYQVRNNHSTLFAAKKYLRDTFICSGDNYFTKNVFMEKSSLAYYAAVYEDGDTDEWCLTTDEEGKIQDVVIGGRDSWVMKGHAYFTAGFSEKFIPFLEKAYRDPRCANQFWEEIYMDHIYELELYVHRYENRIIEEFDSIEELRVFDEIYKDQSGSRILRRISQMLECKESELKEIRPVKEQGKVIGCSFWCRMPRYIYHFETGLLKIEG